MIEIDEQEIVDRLLAQENESTSNPEPTPEPKVESQGETKPEAKDTAPGTTTPEAKVVPKAEAEPTDDDGNPVSYKRFRQIWARAKAEERRAQELQTRLDALQAQGQSGGVPKSQQDLIDEIINEVQGSNDPVAAVRQELFQLRQGMEAQKLSRELDEAVAKYPELPRELLAQKIAEDPRLTAMDVADKLSASLAAYEEHVLAKHRKANPPPVQAPTKPAAPPELRGSKPSNSTEMKKAKAAASYEDLEAAVLRSLGIDPNS